MYLPIYLALLSVLKSRKTLPRYAAAVVDGDFSQVYCMVDDAADFAGRNHCETRERSNEKFTALADVSRLLDDAERAEEDFRPAQKLTWKKDVQLCAQSCRNIGWISLLLGGLTVARHSFSRVANETDVKNEQRIEAYVGVTLAHRLLADACDEPR